jgi:hypothetical protein
MSKFLKIQPSIHCENCIVCDHRPVISKVGGKYVVRCPTDIAHYQTKEGLIDIADWNWNNKAGGGGNIRRVKI